MGRLIINNESSAADDVALAIVIDCVRTGRISNKGKQYCYASKYTINGFRLIVISSLNKNSDSFKIIDGGKPK